VKERRRTAAGDETRARLELAALDLFSKKGYSATSTREVAATLGVQQASLYYHMKNKEDLLRGICYTALSALVDRAEKAVTTARNPREAIRAIGKNHLITTLELQKQFSVGVMECRAIGPEYRAEIQGLWTRYYSIASDVIDKARNQKRVRADVSTRYLYFSLVSPLIWAVLWYRKDKELTIPELDDVFKTVYFEGAGRPRVPRNFSSGAISRNLESLSSQFALASDSEKNETHARLLDTACALFSQKGYSATSVREIADAMGIQKASLYYYISTKEDLIYEISKAALGHMNSSVQWAMSQVSGVQDRLYAFITAHVVSLLQHRNWHAAANEELITFTSKRRSQIVALRDKYESFVRSLLEEAQAAGIVRRDIPAKYLGFVLMGMITHIYPWYQSKVDVPPAELGFLLADIFLTGVSPTWPAKRG